MNPKQMQVETGLALGDRRLPPLQRRVVLAVVALADCSCAEAQAAVGEAMRRDPWLATLDADSDQSDLKCFAGVAVTIAGSVKRQRRRRFRVIEGGAKERSDA